MLLEKLKYYGITGVAHKLMESFIINRKQHVEKDGTKSELLKEWNMFKYFHIIL